MSSRFIPARSSQWRVKQMIRLNIPTDRLLKRTNLPNTWLAKTEATLSPEQCLQIVENALDESGNPALGLTVGQMENLSEAGFLGYAVISSPTLGEAVRAVLEFWELMGNLVKLSFSEDQDFLSWELFPAFPMKSPRLWVYAVEEWLAATIMGGCRLTNQDLRYFEIHVSYPKPDYSDLYSRLFKCQIFFNEKVTKALAPAYYRDLKTTQGHLDVAEICKRQCRELLARFKQSDELVDTIREMIMSLPGRILCLDEVAGRLALSARTLHRRLQERNTSYLKILDETRAALAKEYLLKTNLSAEQISERIGFSEAATFYNSFKKWTGMGVKDFKRRNI